MPPSPLGWYCNCCHIIFESFILLFLLLCGGVGGTDGRLEYEQDDGPVGYLCKLEYLVFQINANLIPTLLT